MAYMSLSLSLRISRKKGNALDLKSPSCAGLGKWLSWYEDLSLDAQHLHKITRRHVPVNLVLKAARRRFAGLVKCMQAMGSVGDSVSQNKVLCD